MTTETHSPLELLADWIEAEAACDGTHEASVLAVLARGRLLQLDPAALRAQVRADKDLRAAASVLHGYSRRYCDGRSTYAPDDHNRATHTLLRLGVSLEPDPLSKTGPFAADGMYGLTEREQAVLAQAEPLGNYGVGGES